MGESSLRWLTTMAFQCAKGLSQGRGFDAAVTLGSICLASGGQLASKITLDPPLWRVESRVTSIAGWGCRRENFLLPLRPTVAGGVFVPSKLGTREGVSSVLANPRKFRHPQRVFVACS